jgi:uncharacterized heparinase superfamily protein
VNIRKLGRVLRTLRYLQPRQVPSTLHYALRPALHPAAFRGAPPALRASGIAAPFLEAPSHAHYDGSGRLRLINREVTFPAGIDWEFEEAGSLWAHHLHEFDYAHCADLTPEARSALILAWIENHPKGIGWKRGPISRRILNWMKLLLSEGSLRLDASSELRVRASLAEQLVTLDRRLEVRLLANHYLFNLLAVVMGGIIFEGPTADGWLRRACELRRQLDEQVLSDGGHIERSPMYHSLVLESVLDLLNALRAAPGRAPAGLEARLREAAGDMLGALRVFTHPDGEIALFGDSAFGIAHSPAELEHYAALLGIDARSPARPGVLDAAGYVRLEAGPFSLLASVAGPMPSYQPGHAHGDALAFELCVAGERVVTDTGIAEYMAGPLRARSRATRSHATAEIAGCDQAEFWSAHRVGGRPTVRLVSVEPGRRVEASCAGWATRDSVHRRVFELNEDELVLCDTIEGRKRAARFTLPLAPGCAVRLDGADARIALPDGSALRVELPEGVTWRIETLPYFPEFGRVLDRSALVGSAEGAGPFLWRFGIGVV